MLLNWSEYFDQEVLVDFEKEHGIKVTEAYYETDELRTEMLINSDGKGYDLILCNGVNVALYAQKKWLAPIPEKKIPNLQYVDQRWREGFPETKTYGVPFFWGTLGIAYRSDLITKPVTGWHDLFVPDDMLRGKIVMIKDSRDLIGMALKAKGYSANSTNPEELDQAKELLLYQKPFVRAYSYVSLSKQSSMVTGQTMMAMIYNGDALMLQEHEPAIKFVQPKEGGSLWCDYFLIASSSLHKEAAYTFLNYIHRPEIMARLAQYAYYASTNTKAAEYLPTDFLTNPTIYPPKEVLEKSEIFQQLPPRTVKKINSIFNLIIQ
ncbi:MAG: spermidine/putrescine ABC transporter substrate-binding protein [Desulfobulbaceae bacterium]|nr:spermidine/putrescine ABC transporter substrate-binding protein [Desulfobulbaceae bacterium]